MKSISNRALAVIVLISLAFSFEIYLLIDEWLTLDGSYSHGLLLFFYSAFLAVQASKNLTEETVSIFAFFGLCICIVIWVISRLLFIEVAAQAMWPVIILAAIATIFGWRNMWRLFIPIGILILAVPIWDYIGYPLQLITVFVDELILSVVGIPFEVDDIYVHLPEKGTFEVAFGCSGLRYLLIASALSLIIAQQWLRRLDNKFKIIIAGVFLGLASNWLRVAIIIYIGDATNMQSPLVDDHETFGWVLFGIMMVPLIYYGNYLEASESKNGDISGSVTDTANHSKAKLGLISLVILSCILLGAWLIKNTKVTNSRSVSIDIAFIPDGWSKLPIGMPNDIGVFFNRPDTLQHSSFFRQEGSIVHRLEGYIYQFDVQRTGRELIQSGNRFYDAERYSVVDTHFDSAGFKYLVLKDRLHNKKLLMWLGYIVNGKFTTDRVKVKLSLLSQPFERASKVAAVAWVLDCGNCTKPVELIQQTLHGSLAVY